MVTGLACHNRGVSEQGSELRARLRHARLYLVCDARPGGRALAPFLDAVLAAGVDIVQLRDKTADDAALRRAAAEFRAATAAHGALFILNDRPALAADVGADGVHVGQDDMPVARARELVGPDRIIGLSTHSPAQVDAAAGVDYIACGPVHATPTKPGRPAVGLALVAHAAAHARHPWFAIGGIDPENVGAVLTAGARRVVVVRAIADAADPAAATNALATALEREPSLGPA
jgi:thiamine-phosphate pyrophosphorylase